MIKVELASFYGPFTICFKGTKIEEEKVMQHEKIILHSDDYGERFTFFIYLNN